PGRRPPPPPLARRLAHRRRADARRRRAGRRPGHHAPPLPTSNKERPTSMLATARDNVMVWNRTPGHSEAWYLTFNDRKTQTGYWMRYVIEAPHSGERYAMLWFACFDAADPAKTVALHKIVPIADFTHAGAPFRLRIGDGELRHDAARGKIAGGGHE